ncbi:hypothetical protein DID75_04985 [Candidatus Marinamargulisbacteria bacterium SCGC AG-410-N11]|nr:hypothetical protein DID75_04985 [Candidatus Marinamargulisbacteria bacterium SCGC AG-410-N11]
MTCNIDVISNNIFTINDQKTKSPIGRRMTIVRLSNNELVVHSPIFYENGMKEQLERLGQLTTILVPNKWHTLDVKKTYDQYPQSKILIPKRLQKELSERFPIHGTYEDDWEKPLADELDMLTIKGLKKPEIIFYHKASKALIVADVFFNFDQKDFSGFTKWLMLMNRAIRFGTTRFYMWAMVNDKPIFKRCLEDMINRWKIEKIIMGHGHIIHTNAEKKVQDAINTL